MLSERPYMRTPSGLYVPADALHEGDHEVEPEPFVHPFEPKPRRWPGMAWWRWATLMTGFVISLLWPPFLGLVLAALLIVWLLGHLLRALAPDAHDVRYDDE